MSNLSNLHYLKKTLKGQEVIYNSMQVCFLMCMKHHQWKNNRLMWNAFIIYIDHQNVLKYLQYSILKKKLEFKYANSNEFVTITSSIGIVICGCWWTIIQQSAHPCLPVKWQIPTGFYVITTLYYTFHFIFNNVVLTVAT